MSKLNVLVVGMSGLGVEVAKNLILAGPRSVAVLDDTHASLMDTAHFYLIYIYTYISFIITTKTRNQTQSNHI